jgi:dolichol kinase
VRGVTVTPPVHRSPSGPLAPLTTRSWLAEARRKTIHLAFILLPLDLLYQWLPWPGSRGQWRLVLIALVVGAIAVDLVRLHDRRVKRFFRTFLGELIREHEEFNLLGSTYLLLAALLAIELFPRPMAAAAIGFTVLGDAFAAMVGRAWGRTRFFGKTLEGAAGGLAACLAWAAFLALTGHLPWSVALAGALVASLVELLPIPLDDNLGMTLFAGYAMKLLGGTA